MPFDDPRDEHYQAFCAALELAGDAPVHVHCIMNYRVSAFFYRYHRRRLGMDEGAVRALLEAQWTPERGHRPEYRAWARFVALA